MARDEYIMLLLDRSADKKRDFLNSHSKMPLNDDEQIEIFSLMESQRMALYMFTSCGWFFDDISGIEAMQVLMYASRAIEVVRSWSKKDLESGLMGFLTKAKSNDRRYGHGGNIYQTLVKASAVGQSLLTANYALASLVRGVEIGSWLSELVHVLWVKDIDINGMMANLGEVDVNEKMTTMIFRKRYLAIRRKDGKVMTCLVAERSGLDPEQLTEEIRSGLSVSFDQGITIFSRHAPEAQRFGLKDLIPDVQKWIIDGLANNLFSQIKGSMSAHYESLQEYINILQEASERSPSFLDISFRLLFIDELLNILALAPGKKSIDFNDLLRPVSLTGPVYPKPSPEKGTAEFLGDILRESALVQKGQGFLRSNMDSIAQSNNIVSMENVINFLKFVRGLKMEPDLWECQNLYFDLTRDNRFLTALSPDGHRLFQLLGRTLGFVTEEP
jgi:hypothetical protein